MVKLPGYLSTVLRFFYPLTEKPLLIESLTGEGEGEIIFAHPHAALKQVSDKHVQFDVWTGFVNWRMPRWVYVTRFAPRRIMKADA